MLTYLVAKNTTYIKIMSEKGRTPSKIKRTLTEKITKDYKDGLMKNKPTSH